MNQTYTNVWLDYRRLENQQMATFFGDIVANTQDIRIEKAVLELINAKKLLFDEKSLLSAEGTIELAIISDENLLEEGYRIVGNSSEKRLSIFATTATGILYGVFKFLELIRTNKESYFMDTEHIENPTNPLRMLNHWDNMDGSIERGYSGNSFFFESDEMHISQRTIDYTRMVASIGINAVVINNVNVKHAATYLITERYLEKVKQINDIFNAYGIKLFLSLNFAAPMELGGLKLCDPLDEDVKGWWDKAIKNVYDVIPNFGGFLVKADSEGRPGPFTYGRTHADGANMLADCIKKYHGLIIWRCFVYNCQQDWRDMKTDRARSGYDHFMPLDGKLHDNVILQIKNGPMDFQVREPVHPLFGGLRKTNQMLEVQIAQEYTGQQKHVCYLIPMFKEVLNFKTYIDEKEDTVADIICGKTLGQTNCGIAAVTNTGDDENWTGHDMAGVNLYGFGRLAWNPNEKSDEIAKDWAMLNFSLSQEGTTTIVEILMQSWITYEKYTSPLGIGWMVNPNHHYGPNVEGYEFDRWGTYHRANWKGVGIDRTKKGTGYTSQYNEPNASLYEHIDTCPEELLLFFHFVEYTHMLSSEKTLIQHIYDTHFEGVEEVEKMLSKLETLKDGLDEKAYERMHTRFEEQLQSAIEWRDRINTYFYRRCGINDKMGRKIYE